MVGLVCRVGQAESNIREAGMEKVHVEIGEVSDDSLGSSVEVDGIIERKHLFRVEISLIVFKRGIEKVNEFWEKSDGRYSLRFRLLFNVLQFLLLILVAEEQ